VRERRLRLFGQPSGQLDNIICCRFFPDGRIAKEESGAGMAPAARNSQDAKFFGELRYQVNSPPCFIEKVRQLWIIRESGTVIDSMENGGRGTPICYDFDLTGSISKDVTDQLYEHHLGGRNFFLA